MTLEELKQIKQDVYNGVLISKSTWLKVLDAAITLEASDNFNELFSSMKNMDWQTQDMNKSWEERIEGKK